MFMAPLIGEGLRSVSTDSIDLPFTLIENARGEERIWGKSLGGMDEVGRVEVMGMELS